MFKKILATLDGSEAAEVILPYAEEITQNLSAELDLVSVSEPGSNTERLLKTYVDKIAAQLKEKGINARGVVIPGVPVVEINDYAQRNNIDLICMATHGRSGITRWMVGSVANKLIRSTIIPVLLIHSKAKMEDRPTKIGFNKILVPLDGSKLGESALSYVQRLAIKLNAAVVLLQVVPPYQTVIIAEGYAVYEDRYIANAISASRSYLKSVEDKLRVQGVNVTSDVEIGNPGDKIIDYAKEKNVDLIAMSTHGRGGFGRWVFGSVAEKVLEAAETPLLLVRAA